MWIKCFFFFFFNPVSLLKYAYFCYRYQDDRYRATWISMGHISPPLTRVFVLSTTDVRSRSGDAVKPYASQAIVPKTPKTRPGPSGA